MNEPIRISITDLIGKPRAIAAADGETVFKEIYPYLKAGTPIALSFAGIRMVITAFLNAAIGKLYRDFVLVLSEFINRFARIEMARLQPGQRDFKAFRNSADFPGVALAIQQQTTQILSFCQPLDHSFAEWNHQQLLTEFAAGVADWNDQLLVENCRKHGVSPLTNDGDFTEGGIPVFTANGRLIKACP